jgi:hypothetical protein
MSELEQLKQALHDARIENSGQAALLERTREEADHNHRVVMAQIKQIEALRSRLSSPMATIRPEPSRLEIAAIILSGINSRIGLCDYKLGADIALHQANALIAEARRSPE